MMAVGFSSAEREQKSQLEWRVAKPNHPDGLATTTTRGERRQFAVCGMQREEKNRWRGLKMAGGILHGSGNERPGPCCLRASCHRHSRESTFARRDGRLANQRLGDYVCPHVGGH